MKKYLYIIIALLLIPILYSAHLFFANNGGNNINIQLKNDSRQDTVYIEGRWDNKIIFNDYFLRTDWYQNYSFNTTVGKHTLTLKSFNINGLIEEKRVEIWVLPFKYFLIEYYGKDFHEWMTKESGFCINSKSTPILIQ